MNISDTDITLCQSPVELHCDWTVRVCYLQSTRSCSVSSGIYAAELLPNTFHKPGFSFFLREHFLQASLDSAARSLPFGTSLFEEINAVNISKYPWKVLSITNIGVRGLNIYSFMGVLTS